MARKITAKAYCVCVMFLIICLYGFGRLSQFVTNKVHVRHLCRSSDLTSSYQVSSEVVSWEILENEVKHVQPGGRYTPTNCIPAWKVAILIPYRNRENNLKVLLRNIHPFLQQQQLEYGIFVLEMPPNTDFNKGLLLNAGFNEVRRLFNYSCFIFNDVDLSPENIKNIYNCSDGPTHLSSAIDTRNYKLLYKAAFGGVISFSKDQFIRINGFSNKYFGWGREDDDLYHRVLNANLAVQRRSLDIGRYKNLGHTREPLGEKNDVLFKRKKQRYCTDGLNNLKYKRITYELRSLYTWILIGVIDHTNNKNENEQY